MVVLFIVFKGTPILLSIVAVSVYIPTNSALFLMSVILRPLTRLVILKVDIMLNNQNLNLW